MTTARCRLAALTAALIAAAPSVHADNWSPAAVPAANDEAEFEALGGTITVDLDPTTTALTIHDALVALAGSFTYTIIYDVSIDAGTGLDSCTVGFMGWGGLYITGGGVGVTDFLELLAHWGPCP